MSNPVVISKSDVLETMIEAHGPEQGRKAFDALIAKANKQTGLNRLRDLIEWGFIVGVDGMTLTIHAKAPDPKDGDYERDDVITLSQDEIAEAFEILGQPR